MLLLGFSASGDLSPGVNTLQPANGRQAAINRTDTTHCRLGGRFAVWFAADSAQLLAGIDVVI
jgi:hypothetical protein